MGNVAGRSKGCSTCRRRRIKCDESHPTCQRCQRAGLECDGPKGITFIEVVNGKTQTTTRLPATNTQQTPPSEDSITPDRQYDLNLRHNRREVYVCYAQKNLHPNGPIDLCLQDLLKDEIDLHSSPSDERLVFDNAFMSFATLYFGSQHRQTDIITQGYVIHGTALSRLNQALSNAVYCFSDSALISVMTLAMSELLVSSGLVNYARHIQGAEKLLDLRDPTALLSCSRRSRDLYKGARHMILFASLLTRRPCILARPDWKLMARAHCSSEELEEQDLHDVLADCSVLLAQLDGRRDTGGANQHPSSSPQHDQMLRQAHDLLQTLQHWETRWTTRTSNTQTNHTNSNPTSPTAQAARILMLFYTAIIHTLAILSILGPNNPSPYFTTTIPDYQTTHPLLLSPPQPGNYHHHQHHNQHQNQDTDTDTNTDTAIWPHIAALAYPHAMHLAALAILRLVTHYLDDKRARRDARFVSPAVQFAVATAGGRLGW